MVVLSISDICLSFGEKKVLSNVSMVAQKGEKLGIVGVNGAGKTTLLKIISGELNPNEGKIFISKDCNVGYLKQEDENIKELSVFMAVLASYNHLLEMEKQLRQLEKSISCEAELAKNSGLAEESQKLLALMKKYATT